MNKIITCVSIEGKKLFHSKIPLMTLLALTLVPFIGGLFMFILKDPVLAQKMGIISAKAQIMGSADWPSYLSLLSQAISVGGLLVFGFTASWIFGREYSDSTIKDLLALPVSRDIIVYGKFIVSALWCLFLSFYVLGLGLIVGIAMDIPGWSEELMMRGSMTFIVCAILTISLSAPVALFASAGRGYLTPLGFMIFTLVLAQIIAATGYGQYFPWSIPAITSRINAGEDALIENISLVIILLTSASGLAGTICWWRYADQN